MQTDPTQQSTTPSPFTRDEVEAALDKVRPGIERHGGRLELVCVDGCNVRVALHGACVGCPSSTMTLKFAIERQLREELAGFGELIAEAPRPAHSSEKRWWQRFL